MKPSQLLIAAAAAMALAGAANAALLTGKSGSPANAVTDFSTPSLLAFDLDLQDFSSTKLHFILQDDDLHGTLGMNALVRNLSGHGIRHFTFSLQGIAFATPGSVTPAFGTIRQMAFDGKRAAIGFGTPEYAEFQFGNPFGLQNRSDWMLDTRGLRAGDAFSITATVPEPSTFVLLLSALAMMGVYAIRKG